MTKFSIIQFIKYGLCGGLANVVHIVVFHIAAWVIFPALEEGDLFVRFFRLIVQEIDVATRSLNSMLSNGIAFLCSNTVAYITNVLWVFKAGRHNRTVELLLFYSVAGVSILVGTGIMGLLIRLFEIRTTYAFVINVICAVLFNFAFRKYVIFKG